MDNKQKQVLALLESLEDASFKQKRKIAAQFGVELPTPEIREQVAESYLKLNHIPRKAEEGTEGKDYVVIPSLTIGNDQTKPIWVRLEAAQDVGERLIALANEAKGQ